MKQKIKDVRNRLFGVDELKNEIFNLIKSRYNLSIESGNLVNDVHNLVDNLKIHYPLAEGHDVLAAITKLNQMQLPYGVDSIPHAIAIPKHGTYAPWKEDGFFTDGFGKTHLGN